MSIDLQGSLPSIKGATRIDLDVEEKSSGKLGNKKVSFSPDSVIGFLPSISPIPQNVPLEEKVKNIEVVLVPPQKVCVKGERKIGKGSLEPELTSRPHPFTRLKEAGALPKEELEPLELPKSSRVNRTRIGRMRDASVEVSHPKPPTDSKPSYVNRVRMSQIKGVAFSEERIKAREGVNELDVFSSRQVEGEEHYADDFEPVEGDATIKAHKVAIDIGIVDIPKEEAKDDEDYDRWFLPDSPRLSPPTPERVVDRPYTIAELNAMLPPSRFPPASQSSIHDRDDKRTIDREFDLLFS